MIEMVVTRTARKEWKCALKSGCTIKPGERYTETTIAPWILLVDDRDDDGRPVGSPAGAWMHERFHGACAAEVGWMPS